MILANIMEGISKTARELSVLMKVYTIPCHDRGHIIVMLVVQSCTGSVQVLPGSSSESFPTTSDCTCDVGNVEVEEDLDMQEEEEVNVKIEEEDCISIKYEDGIYSEEEKEEDIDIKEGKDVVAKEEVSCWIHYNDLKNKG